MNVKSEKKEEEKGVLECNSKTSTDSHTFMLTSIHPSTAVYWCDVVAKPLSLATVSLQARCGKQLQRLPLSTRGRKVGSLNPLGTPRGYSVLSLHVLPMPAWAPSMYPFILPTKDTCLGER